MTQMYPTNVALSFFYYLYSCKGRVGGKMTKKQEHRVVRRRGREEGDG